MKYNKDLIISGERLVKTLNTCVYIKLDNKLCTGNGIRTGVAG